jgi:hypothetical protein
MPSAVYALFRQAILEEKQITCMYQGYYREICPLILGHTDGEEVALTYQFGGESRSGLKRSEPWRCLKLAEVTDVRLREGPRHEGKRHRKEQTCVEDVDLDINVHVRRLR